MSPSERLKFNLNEYWHRLADEGWPRAHFKIVLETKYPTYLTAELFNSIKFK